MMGPAGYLIAILGCGESDAPCQQVQLAPVRYESEAACLAASGEQVARHADLPYPVVVAECRPAAARTAALRGDQVRLPEPRGPLPGNVRTASRR
jgi:hypothetical protein